MRSSLVRIALALAAVAAGCAALGGGAAGQAQFPPCPPGAPPIPPPTVAVKGDPSAPGRIVAGRPFQIEYGGEAIVQETAGPPGTTFSSNDLLGATVTVAAPGPAVFTARYYDDRVGCSQTFSFTVNVEVGDLLIPRSGYAEGPSVREISRFARLPRKGALTSQAPVAGIQFICFDTTGIVPVVADLRVERNLRRRPSAASPGATMTVSDPCSPKPTTILAPGARLRHTGEAVAVEHRFGKGARYWLRITQAGRVLWQVRYYVAFGRKQTMFVQKAWVIAPEAAFEAARCRKRARGDLRDPLGYQNYPIPPCPR
jgi:hemin uptake protein HemP